MNNDLERLIAEIRETNRDLEAFSYSVSHDLKQPLNVIDGLARLVSERSSSVINEEDKGLLDDIQTKMKQMARLIDDLLTFSSAGRQEMKHANIDMVELTKSVYSEITADIPDRNISIEIREMPSAWGDHALIRQVMTNLLSNAVKYTRKRPEPVIEVSGTVNERETVYCVHDNGIGFDTKDRDRLFVVFQRLQGSREFEGSGVGLSIVQRIVLRHVGRVWAEGKPGDGATFCFSLPIRNELV